MKIVKCKVCEYVPELTDEEIEEFAKIARRRKLKIDKYLGLFSIGIEDEHHCPGQYIHKFALEDDLELDINNTVKEYKNSIDNVNKNTKALEDHKKTLEKLLGMVEKTKEVISTTEGIITEGSVKIKENSEKILEKTKIPIDAYM